MTNMFLRGAPTLIALCVLCGSLASYAAEPAAVLPPADATPQSAIGVASADKLEHLRRLATAIGELRSQVLAETDELKRMTVRGLRRRKMIEIDAIQARLDKTRASFQSLAADIDLSHLREVPRVQQRDLLAELRELTAPVLDAFRRLSAKPRRIEGLRAEIASLRDRIQSAQRAQIIVTQLQGSAGAGVGEELALTRARVRTLVDELQLELGDRERALHTLTDADVSVVDSAAAAVTEFLTTKGRNAVAALLTWLLLALGMMAMQERLLPTDRMQAGRFAWLRKPLTALYGAVVFVIASFGALLCLYLLRDMLLLTVAILVLSFIVWSTRSVLPHVLREVRLMLNLGSVREGERIIWRGVPWRVAKLGIRPTLENPALQGGRVRVRAAMLVDDVSREMHPDEPWFATDVGDWVVMQDGTWARVDVQTPEQVVVAVAGQERRRYELAAFLAAGPTNLSHGFLRRVVLPVDVGLLGELDTVRAALTERLKTGIAGEVAAAQGGVIDIAVRALPPTPVALRIEVRITCDGTLDGSWRALEFATVALWLRLCHERGWRVPSQARLLQLDADFAPDS